jgi:hypothetical protein
MAVLISIGTLSPGSRFINVMRSGVPKPRCMMGLSVARMLGHVLATTLAS